MGPEVPLQACLELIYSSRVDGGLAEFIPYGYHSGGKVVFSWSSGLQDLEFHCMASGTGKSGWVEHLLVRAQVTVGLTLEFINVFHDFEALDQVGPHASEFQGG